MATPIKRADGSKITGRVHLKSSAQGPTKQQILSSFKSIGKHPAEFGDAIHFSSMQEMLNSRSTCPICQDLLNITFQKHFEVNESDAPVIDEIEKSDSLQDTLKKMINFAASLDLNEESKEKIYIDKKYINYAEMRKISNNYFINKEDKNEIIEISINNFDKNISDIDLYCNKNDGHIYNLKLQNINDSYVPCFEVFYSKNKYDIAINDLNIKVNNIQTPIDENMFLRINSEKDLMKILKYMMLCDTF